MKLKYFFIQAPNTEFAKALYLGYKKAPDSGLKKDTKLGNAVSEVGMLFFNGSLTL